MENTQNTRVEGTGRGVQVKPQKILSEQGWPRLDKIEAAGKPDEAFFFINILVRDVAPYLLERETPSR